MVHFLGGGIDKKANIAYLIPNYLFLQEAGMRQYLIAILSILVLSPAWAEEAKMKIASPEFSHNGSIPSKFTCDGGNINPPLSFEGVPSGTKSLALIMDDPDAPRGTWVHWVLWNISPEAKGIGENSTPKEAMMGVNDSRKNGDYGGPCPPSGTHRYFFKLYALDTALSLDKGSEKAELEKAMEGHILAQAELIGLYKRR